MNKSMIKEIGFNTIKNCDVYYVTSIVTMIFKHDNSLNFRYFRCEYCNGSYLWKHCDFTKVSMELSMELEKHYQEFMN